MKIRALIADDEPLSRDRLRALLAKAEDVEIAGEAHDGDSAIAAVRRLKPDVLFLDIHMPGRDGFDVLESLEPESIPWTIFLTAHDRHAVRAFEAQALDYLLKPVAKERLGLALERVRQRLSAAQPVPALQEWLAARESSRRIVVRNGSRLEFVSTDSIHWLESAGNYALIHAAGRNHIHRETLNELERRLPAEHFLRISRSAIVNLLHLTTLDYHDGHTVAVLDNGHRLAVTRSKPEIERRLRRL